MTRPATANPGHCLMRAVITKRARGLLEDVIKHLPATSAERAALDAAVRLIVQADELRTQERDAAQRTAAAITGLCVGYAGPVNPAED